MNGTPLGFLLPLELIAPALALAGLALIVGLRRIARLLLVAVAIAAFVAPFVGALVASLPLAPRVAIALVLGTMLIGSLARLLLGRHVWQLIVANVVSQVVITMGNWVLRLAVVRYAMLGAVVALGLWLWMHV